ncbi:hypothetical protein [Ruegeria sp. PrR005]|uniref:DUF1127 domain-containing protein n=1 Tax=Ruegeria sp. PrR005 TaxID=2706882 RepID=A0A6B2NTQ6_9RHOB|nr:hypothetical protein [Ruegeria sp. PrR005]NDW45275.1 hypothetical protein [Ruegeria sp. PrR005]
MTDYPISATRTGGYLSIAGKLWRDFQTNRKALVERRKRNEALRELNSAELRDIGYVKDEKLEIGYWQFPQCVGPVQRPR